MTYGIDIEQYRKSFIKRKRNHIRRRHKIKRGEIFQRIYRVEKKKKILKETKENILVRT